MTETRNPWEHFGNVQITTSDGKTVFARFMRETGAGVFVEELGIRVFYPFSSIVKIAKVGQ